MLNTRSKVGAECVQSIGETKEAKIMDATANAFFYINLFTTIESSLIDRRRTATCRSAIEASVRLEIFSSTPRPPRSAKSTLRPPLPPYYLNHSTFSGFQIGRSSVIAGSLRDRDKLTPPGFFEPPRPANVAQV